MFVSPAFAQSAGDLSAPNVIESLVPFLLIFAVFYFLLIRPQQKKMKEHKSMLGSIRRGDKIVTNGGIFADVVKVINENELEVKIAEGVKVRVDRNMVSYVNAKTEPADKSDKAAKSDNADNDDDNNKGSDDDKGGSSGGGLRGLLSGKKKT
ncbi:MAG: preprotein translocase subunit YajC [Rhodospirillaceae bacterium]|nr:preprotein translocase subunit YajC [Rhodospirillaceae bacterium]